MGQRRHGGLLEWIHALELVGFRKLQWHVDVDRRAVIRLHHADGCGHHRTPIPALRDPACVPEAPHKRDPGASDPGNTPARLSRLIGEAVTRERRCDYVEGVLGLAAMGGRVGQGTDDLHEFDHRTWPAVSNDQRQRVLVLRADM